jgi:hypothetical protein
MLENETGTQASQDAQKTLTREEVPVLSQQRLLVTPETQFTVRQATDAVISPDVNTRPLWSLNGLMIRQNSVGASGALLLPVANLTHGQKGRLPIPLQHGRLIVVRWLFSPKAMIPLQNRKCM